MDGRAMLQRHGEPAERARTLGRTGGIRLTRFCERRVRRLFPAGGDRCDEAPVRHRREADQRANLEDDQQITSGIGWARGDPGWPDPDERQLPAEALQSSGDARRRSPRVARPTSPRARGGTVGRLDLHVLLEQGRTHPRCVLAANKAERDAVLRDVRSDGSTEARLERARSRFRST